MLIVIDTQWKDHLLSIDHLKEGIGLRGYGQRDPLTEYKKKPSISSGHGRAREGVGRRAALQGPDRARHADGVAGVTAWARAQESRGEIAGRAEPSRAARRRPRARAAPAHADREKIGRNDPCYCGSGKKYKKCHYLKA
jgi:preprotein translocase subunit SecA